MVSGFHVEHRVPKGRDRALEFEWSNLFPCCEGCNLRRKKDYPEGGLLDPAGGQNVEGRLVQRIVDWPGLEQGPYFAATDEADRAAANTAAELHRIHNDDATSSLKPADLRRAILVHQRRVFGLCLRYLKKDMTEFERQEMREHLRRLLSRRAPYTALTRSELADLGAAIVELFD